MCAQGHHEVELLNVVQNFDQQREKPRQWDGTGCGRGSVKAAAVRENDFLVPATSVCRT